jgi:hypothetical protein
LYGRWQDCEVKEASQGYDGAIRKQYSQGSTPPPPTKVSLGLLAMQNTYLQDGALLGGALTRRPASGNGT